MRRGGTGARPTKRGAPSRRGLVAVTLLASGVAASLAVACALDSGGAAVLDDGLPRLASDAGAPPLDDAGDPTGFDADALATADAVAPPFADAAPRLPCTTAPLGLSAWVHGDVGYDGQWNQVPLTRRGAPQLGALPDGGAAFFFAGGQDAVVFGSGGTLVEAPLALTVEGWLSARDTSGNARLADRTVPNKPETGWGFDVLSGGALRLFYGPLDGTFHYVQSAAGAIVVGRWQHVGGTVLGTPASGGPGKGTIVMKLYVDGIERGTATFNDQRAIPQSTLPLTLGNSAIENASPTLGLTGGLSELATWRRTLTATEIGAVATGGPGARCGL